MDDAAVLKYICDTFDGVQTLTADGNTFFYYDLDHGIPINQRFGFATLIINDLYDQFSNLDRDSVYRLNIGVSKETYRSLLGESAGDAEDADTEAPESSGYDYTALNQIMPHPMYGRMHWLCVLNPSDETFQNVVQPLLAEAYQMDVDRTAKWLARHQS